jgi:hypothetical protein
MVLTRVLQGSLKARRSLKCRARAPLRRCPCLFFMSASFPLQPAAAPAAQAPHTWSQAEWREKHGGVKHRRGRLNKRRTARLVPTARTTEVRVNPGSSTATGTPRLRNAVCAVPGVWRQSEAQSLPPPPPRPFPTWLVLRPTRAPGTPCTRASSGSVQRAKEKATKRRSVCAV